MLIGCISLFDLKTYFLYIILYYKNLKLKYLIDNIAIDLWSSRNFATMEDVKRKYNQMVDLLKFTSNKKNKEEFVVIAYKLICRQTLFFSNKEKKRKIYGQSLTTNLVVVKDYNFTQCLFIKCEFLQIYR